MRVVLSAIEERLTDSSSRALADAVAGAVRDGVIQEGEPLPPIRTLARELLVSPTTVSAAWRILMRAGVIRTQGRRGTVVGAPDRPRPSRYGRVLAEDDGVRDLSTGVPDPTLLPPLGAALSSLPTSAAAHSYLEDPVLPELREVLLADWPYAPELLAVFDGSMDALDHVARATLRLGDRVAVENPSFPPLVDLLEAIGVQPVGVPLDEEGLQPDALAAVLAGGATAVLLQPRAQNPTGLSMTPARAERLAEICAGGGTLVIEDDSMGATSVAAPLSLGRWLPSQTVHVRSFSKTHGPDLRLAAASGPATVLGEALARRQLGQGWTSRLLQRVLLDLLTRPESVDAVAHARTVYARRRQALVDALAQRGVDCPGSDGLNLWVPVRDESAAVVALARDGFGVAPGSPFAVGGARGHHVRVTTALVDDDVEELADALARAATARAWSPGPRGDAGQPTPGRRSR